MKLAYVALFALLMMAFGCKPAQPSTQAEKTPAQPANTVANGASGGGGETIAPMGGVGAGPMTPVAGSDSVAGGGSGVGSVMKDRARGLAGKSPSSLNQMPSDEGN